MKIFTISLLAACVFALAPAGALAQAAAAPGKASAYPVAPAHGLYTAMGEQAGIRVLMSDFVARLKAEPRFGKLFKETQAATLSERLAEQVCVLSGGPCVYQGASMKDAHADMGITRAEFNLLVELLQQAMDARGINFSRQNQLLALLAPLHRDVVGQ